MSLFSKFHILCFVILLSLSGGGFAQQGELTPRKIAKTGEVQTPEGMHIVTSRTGERWLVPLDMQHPPASAVRDVEYYKASNEPKWLKNFDGHKLYNQAMSGEDVFVDEGEFWKRIPKAFADLMKDEKDYNLHGQSDHFKFLGDFGPASKKPFIVPYIPIPEEDMDFSHLSDYASDDTKKFVVTEKNGKRVFRAFIHPNYPENYQELIEKYGIVYHHVGITTSSPRSLVVIDPDNPSVVHWVKPSLPKKIDGSVRLNIDTKLRRAVIMSEALAKISLESRKNYGVDFMTEPASLQFPGKKFGTIFREVNTELMYPGRGKKWIPAFALNAPGPSGKPIIQEMVKKSGKPAEEFIQESIIRPFLKSYLALALHEGLPGEFHTQNFYYELNSRGLPTGRFIFKDNDGFRFDVELAMRKKRGLKYLSKFDRPFYWAKFSNALGKGGEGVQFLGSWYYKLIRNVNGFETLSSYILSVMKATGHQTWSKDGIQRLFDDTALEEAQKMTGVDIPESSKYGFGKDKGLNEILNLHRRNLAEVENIEVWKDDPEVQKILEQAYAKVKSSGHAHERGTVGAKAYYLPHVMDDGTVLIEARSAAPRNKYKNPTLGVGIIQADSELEEEVTKKIARNFASCLN